MFQTVQKGFRCEAREKSTDALDQQFKEFIQALKGAVNSAMPHLKDDPKVVDKAITDCREILDVVMEGNVKEWLS